MDKTKPYSISKKGVMAAWERVRANKGTYGIDEETIKDFESNLKDNLYKLWKCVPHGHKWLRLQVARHAKNG
ncbi:hypothetical protein FACS189472_15850 [Alphaproteobacteria bacterium]|nr:hypothetical protein FACS189472_15850 [Alphaproteobacteria bacterium]